jgi:hypothetical protein
MNLILFSIVFFIFSLHIFAQEDAVVSGRILDKTTLQPLAFATVTITQGTEGKILTGTMTDENGRFSITPVPQGEYTVICSYLGYRQKKISLLVGRLNKSYDLGKIELDPDAAILGEVVISENKNLRLNMMQPVWPG